MRRYIAVTCKAGERQRVEAIGASYASVADAATAIADTLQGFGVDTEEADRLARQVTGGRVGAIQSHDEHPDVLFRVLEADFMSDGTPITPGLRVEDYDRRIGVVDPAQFMDTGVMAPGGKYFRRPDGSGWYDVIREADGRTRKSFDGSRMRAL